MCRLKTPGSEELNSLVEVLELNDTNQLFEAMRGLFSIETAVTLITDLVKFPDAIPDAFQPESEGFHLNSVDPGAPEPTRLVFGFNESEVEIFRKSMFGFTVSAHAPAANAVAR